jgi:hypothetical protein
MQQEEAMPIRGSCHCGKIAYSLDATPTEAIECNCSICRRRGSVLAAVRPDAFHLETSRDDITVYTFGKHVIRHQFCKRCGCAPFAEGTGPGGVAMVVINLRCAENLDLSTIKVTRFDGASL